MQTFRFEVLTWNIAGTADADAYAILEKDLRADVVAFQEWSRRPPGWERSSVDGFQDYIRANICTGQ